MLFTKKYKLFLFQLIFVLNLNAAEFDEKREDSESIQVKFHEETEIDLPVTAIEIQENRKLFEISKFVWKKNFTFIGLSDKQAKHILKIHTFRKAFVYDEKHNNDFLKWINFNFLKEVIRYDSEQHFKPLMTFNFCQTLKSFFIECDEGDQINTYDTQKTFHLTFSILPNCFRNLSDQQIAFLKKLDLVLEKYRKKDKYNYQDNYINLAKIEDTFENQTFYDYLYNNFTDENSKEIEKQFNIYYEKSCCTIL